MAIYCASGRLSLRAATASTLTHHKQIAEAAPFHQNASGGIPLDRGRLEVPANPANEPRHCVDPRLLLRLPALDPRDEEDFCAGWNGLEIARLVVFAVDRDCRFSFQMLAEARK